MSTATAAKWEAMEPRSQNLWIAEHVMGYVFVTHERVVGHVVMPAEAERLAVLCRREQWDYQVHETLPDRPVDDSALPKFSTDASSDYLVLEKARTWNRSKRQKFDDALATVHYQHTCRGVEPLCETYRPGDYSRAAYLALTD